MQWCKLLKKLLRNKFYYYRKIIMPISNFTHIYKLDLYGKVIAYDARN